MSSTKLKKLLLAFLAITALAWSAQRAYFFSVLNWRHPWPHPVLAIDGNSYLKGAELLASGAVLFPIPDIYHSPGYQYFLGLLFWVAGSSYSGIVLSKAVYLLLFGISVALTYFLARKVFGPRVAVVASILLFCSTSWLYYSHMLQYEVLVGFLLLVWLVSATVEKKRSAHELVQALLSGLLLLALIFIHGRFLFLAVIPIWEAWIFWRKKDFRRFSYQLTTLFTALIPVVVWSIIYSKLYGHIVWIMDRRADLFRMGNNPNSVGLGYPHPIIVEPSGWEFIFSRPLNVLWLIEQRFLYIWGIKADVWAIPPPSQSRTDFETTLYIIACMGFFVGAFLSGWKRSEFHVFGQKRLYLAIIGILGPPLFIFGHHRLLVPVIPLVAIFQAIAMVEIWNWFFKKAAT